MKSKQTEHQAKLYTEARAMGCEIKDYEVYKLQRARIIIRQFIKVITLSCAFFILGSLYVIVSLLLAIAGN